ncbi:hypothetical protein GCM10007036_38170 [Alsobacter metallidurans]|uniref:DUF58 domain-containing protein n=1 Tax=Alsobacter metallidurans TaxID=340221 RepID=A0A917MLA5_9HYPH|nr:DUF58 domain-containing protein [Alsobacter metallidurans]GGH28754.1 hypothetical protein GCM10007036_38170 [Alsobacter metallidurans]
MVKVRVLDTTERAVGNRHATGALDLARRLPRLAIEARRIAATAAHGIHGRRQAGSGEAFWQFRAFMPGEPAHRVDWRRSARDDERYYVREREWEAAHTVWLWIDRSASMGFSSALAQAPKVDRAVVLGLALADLLVRGGERVGHIGLTNPQASRSIVDRVAEALAADKGAPADLPPPLPLAPLTEAVLISDFLTPAPRIKDAIERMAARGAGGHLVMVLDPVEETFPFEGQAVLAELEGPQTLRVGDAGSFGALVRERMAAHRDAIREACARRGWTFAVHRTDRPASEALLSLAARIAERDAGMAGARIGAGT